MATVTNTVQQVANILLQEFQPVEVQANDLYAGQDVLIVEQDMFMFGTLKEDGGTMDGYQYSHLHLNGTPVTTTEYVTDMRGRSTGETRFRSHVTADAKFYVNYFG
jgi:hypothetical protein